MELYPYLKERICNAPFSGHVQDSGMPKNYRLTSHTLFNEAVCPSVLWEMSLGLQGERKRNEAPPET